MKRILELSLSVILIFISLTAVWGAPRKAPPPNIVFVYFDDLGFGDLGCYGNPKIRTPHLDKMATEGILFTNFTVASPVCSPSRVGVMTGQFPSRQSFHGHLADLESNRRRGMPNYLDPDVETMTRILQSAGYSTGHFGKWHMGGGRDLWDVPIPTEYGFDKSLVSGEGRGDRIAGLGNGGKWAQYDTLGKGNIVRAENYLKTSIYIDSALAFIRLKKDSPFFINFCPNDVHDLHRPKPGTEKAFKDITDNPLEQKFFAVLAELDKQIGRFIGELDKMGKLDNTIIIFTSDNGPTDWPWYYEPKSYPKGYDGEMYPPGFAGEFFGRKWSLYEGGIRMPFIISWPGKIPAGKTDDQTVMSAIDLFPSICSILKLDWPENLDGTDKSKALLGEPMLDTPPIMWEYGSNPGGGIIPGNSSFISPNLAMREGEWKLLINADSTEMQLFNLIKDPGEKNNLAKSESARAADMAQRLIDWRITLPVEIKKANDINFSKIKH
jgi:arylsulfatase A-like enzyme